jgi:hypothetical protein
VLGAALGIVTAGTLAFVVGAAAAEAGAFSLARSAADVADKYNDLSAKINFNTHTLSGLDVAGAQAGVTFESIGSSLGIFDKKLEDASEKTTKLGRVLKANNVDVHDNQKALEGMFTVLSKLPEGHTQTALAMEAFGKGGKEMLGIVKAANGDLPALLRYLDDMGATLSDKDAKAANEFNDKLALLGKQFDMAKVKVGSELMPVFERLFDNLSGWLSHNEGELRSWGQTFADVAGGIITWAGRIERAVSAISSMTPPDKGFVKTPSSSMWDKFWDWADRPSINTSQWEQGTGRGTTHMATPEEIAAQARQNGGGDDDAKKKQAAADAISKLLGGNAGGGKRGGGGRARQSKDLTSLLSHLAGDESSLRMSSFNFGVTKFKAELDVEQQALEASLREQLTSVADYWKQRERLTLAGIDNEIDKLKTERAEAARVYNDKAAAIGADKKTSEAEKGLKLQIENTRWQTKDLQLQGQIAEATEKRKAAQAEIASQTRQATKDLERSMNALKVNYLEGTNDQDGALRLRLADKFADLHALAQANKTLFPDADKWVTVVEKLERLEGQLGQQRNHFDLMHGTLDLDAARIQDQITDGVLSERDGRRQVYKLEVKYRETLRGILGEMLAIAQLRDDKKEVQNIQAQIREVERLGHVINETKARARGIFKDSLTTGLEELDQGLKKAAVDFGLSLLKSVRDAFAQKAARGLGDALFGKSDEYGSSGGLLGGLAKRLGLGNIFDGKGKTPQAAAADRNTVAEDLNTTALHELTAVMRVAGNGGGSQLPGEEDFAKFLEENNTISADTLKEARDISANGKSIDGSVNLQGANITNSIRQLEQTFIALQPRGPGLLGQILMAAVSGAAQGLMSGGGGEGGGGSSGGGLGHEAGHSGSAGSYHNFGYEIDDATGRAIRPRTVGRRATGGPVSAGELYMVNEREEEYFRPNFGGEVIPLSKMGGAHGGHHEDHRRYYTINLPAVRPHSYTSRPSSREMAESLVGFLKSRT